MSTTLAGASRDEREGRPPQPEGWRTGPGMFRRSPRCPGLLAILGVLALVALVVVAMRPGLITDTLSGDDTGSNAAPLATETTPPTAAPSKDLSPDRPTLKEPFRGSPAASWADGAIGIQLPVARAVGGMSEDQVDHALRRAKELLVVANLDPATLRGEHPAARWRCSIRARRTAADCWSGLYASRARNDVHGDRPSGPAVDPYDRSKGIEAGQEEGCGAGLAYVNGGPRGRSRTEGRSVRTGPVRAAV